jgi:hypothetical protein
VVTGRVEKIAVTPHEKRRGTLRNASPSGDFLKAARCGAKNRVARHVSPPYTKRTVMQASRRA